MPLKPLAPGEKLTVKGPLIRLRDNPDATLFLASTTHDVYFLHSDPITKAVKEIRVYPVRPLEKEPPPAKLPVSTDPVEWDVPPESLDGYTLSPPNGKEIYDLFRDASMSNYNTNRAFTYTFESNQQGGRKTRRSKKSRRRTHRRV